VEGPLRAEDGDRSGELAALRVAGDTDAARRGRAADGGAACHAAGGAAMCAVAGAAGAWGLTVTGGWGSGGFGVGDLALAGGFGVAGFALAGGFGARWSRVSRWPIPARVAACAVTPPVAVRTVTLVHSKKSRMSIPRGRPMARAF
jgi:hypothetical protein